MLKVQDYFNRGRVVLDTDQSSFINPECNYYILGWKFNKRNNTVLPIFLQGFNDKSREKRLSRFAKRASKTTRFMGYKVENHSVLQNRLIWFTAKNHARKNLSFMV